MRLLLLPISTRRTLIYCQRAKVQVKESQTLVDKATARAANLWASWEKKESGWQRTVVDYGNKALQRIPYEEWGLKSIPPLSARRRREELGGKDKVTVSFPSGLIPEEELTEVLRTLATERQGLHRKTMIWCFVGMPITAPIAIIPVIPNLPFFYLVFRAWSHWRALAGSKHLEFLLDKNLVAPEPSVILNEIYARGKPDFGEKKGPTVDHVEAKQKGKEKEELVLQKEHAREISQALQVPELEMELGRALWQVRRMLKAQEALVEEKKEMDKAGSQRP
ncbi:mitochondrial K+-H+ exchange-related-domain-containing protein [Xylogone sp. PMI_703]|nr:mitochondrial K+-H+ exchange-related-domain-containing protein [Xylogone sp. PMI_703]